MVLGTVLGIMTSSTLAQHRHGHHSHSPTYKVDHHDHIVRDSHGHIIGQYHHDIIRDNIIRDNSRYIVPHSGNNHHGTYQYRDNGYYYAPQTGHNHQGGIQEVRVQFGGFSHVEDLASRLETLANEFCLDLHHNYSHNQGFKETYNEAYQILQIAEFIHGAEHNQDRQAIQESLGGIDRLFHHVQEDVSGWSRHQHRQIGQLGILSKMDLMESTIHHLMNDVGVRSTEQNVDERAPQPGNDPNRAPRPENSFDQNSGPINSAPPRSF